MFVVCLENVHRYPRKCPSLSQKMSVGSPENVRRLPRKCPSLSQKMSLGAAGVEHAPAPSPVLNPFAPETWYSATESTSKLIKTMSVERLGNVCHVLRECPSLSQKMSIAIPANVRRLSRKCPSTPQQISANSPETVLQCICRIINARCAAWAQCARASSMRRTMRHFVQQ